MRICFPISLHDLLFLPESFSASLLLSYFNKNLLEYNCVIKILLNCISMKLRDISIFFVHENVWLSTHYSLLSSIGQRNDHHYFIMCLQLARCEAKARQLCCVAMLPKVANTPFIPLADKRVFFTILWEFAENLGVLDLEKKWFLHSTSPDKQQ